MEKILFGSTIPDLSAKTIADLTTNQVAMYLYSNDGMVAPVLFGNEVTNAKLLQARGVQFIKKKADGTFDASLIIPNNTTRNRNYQAYVAGVAGVFKLGDKAATTTALDIPTTGEGCIRLTDLTDTYVTDDFGAAVICLTKKLTETNVQYLNRFVLAINKDPKAGALVTASLANTTTNYELVLTTKDFNSKLGIDVDGISENYTPMTVTPRVMAMGTGVQMQKIEAELTVFKGNGNYMENGDLYYKEPLKSNLASNYNTMSISWTGTAQPTVSTTMFVANLNFLICVPTADTTLKKVYDAFTITL